MRISQTKLFNISSILCCLVFTVLGGKSTDDTFTESLSVGMFDWMPAIPSWPRRLRVSGCTAPCSHSFVLPSLPLICNTGILATVPTKRRQGLPVYYPCLFRSFLLAQINRSRCH